MNEEFLISNLVSALALSVLIASFLMAGRTRLVSLVELFRVQSILLAVYAGVLAYTLPEYELFVATLFILIIKAGIVPEFFKKTGMRSGVSARLESFLNPAVRQLVAAIIIITAFLSARAFEFPTSHYLIIAASFSLIGIGSAMLISRKDMFGQGTGFLTLENGIFLFGLALVHGMPLIIEIGILFDVLVGFVLMFMLLNKAQDVAESVSTDKFRTLLD